MKILRDIMLLLKICLITKNNQINEVLYEVFILYMVQTYLYCIKKLFKILTFLSFFFFKNF